MKQTTHTSNSHDWSIVPYDGRSPFKKVRIRDEVNIRRIVTHLTSPGLRGAARPAVQ